MDKPLMKRVTITLTQEQLRLIRSTNIGSNDAEAIRGLAMAWLAEKSMLSTTAKNRMANPEGVVTAEYYTINPVIEEANPKESSVGVEEHHCPVCGQRHVYLTSREMAVTKERTQKENCHACHAQYYHKVDYRKPAGEIKQSQMKKFYEKQ